MKTYFINILKHVTSSRFTSLFRQFTRRKKRESAILLVDEHLFDLPFPLNTFHSWGFGIKFLEQTETNDTLSYSVNKAPGAI